MPQPIDPAEFRIRADNALHAISEAINAQAVCDRATTALQAAKIAEAKALNAFAAYVAHHAGFMDGRLFDRLPKDGSNG